MPSLVLKPDRSKSLERRHPWIFASAISEINGSIEPGETVEVYDNMGKFLAKGAYSHHSQIRVRVWTWNQREVIDREFFRKRLQNASSSRMSYITPSGTNAVRLVHGESDRLPGLIVDRYDNFLVVQYLSCGPDHWREILADLLVELTGVQNIYERSDVDVRTLEGLPPRVGVLRGVEPPIKSQICENGLIYWVDIQHGHKTGFYLDQRNNRACLRELSRGKEVLDCFCYSGGFTISALAGGATSVLAVDSSADALALAQANVSLNSFDEDRVVWLEGDVFQVLREFRDRGRCFDLIVLDPPKFAPTVSQAERAARAYKDINLLAIKLLRPGGLLFTFSCSGGITAELFQKIVAGAALDAGKEAQIIGYLQQSPDHPVALNFPEGAYLKGLIVKVE